MTSEDLFYALRSSLLRMLASCYHVHAESCGEPGDFAADAAESDEAECGTGNFTRARAPAPQQLLSPNVFLLQVDSFGDFFRQRENERNHVLCDHRAVDLAGVGQDDVTVD